MIKRIVEISREPAHLTVKQRQLLVKHGPKTAGSIPCEDISMVVVDHPGTTYSHAALTTLANNNAAVVICGADHLPSAMLLPFSKHSEVVHRLRTQLDVSKPRQKQIWKQIVSAKIRGQAQCTDTACPARRKLFAMSTEVKSGDPNNLEAQAARIYWKNFLSDEERFYRDREASGLNGMLNYGYAILRAAVARAIVAGGFLPAIGIHHHNRSNPFCLADDLMEPLRPLVDFMARDLFRQGYQEVTSECKAELLALMTETVRTGNETGPLMISLHRMVASLEQCFSGKSKKLLIAQSTRLNEM